MTTESTFFAPVKKVPCAEIIPGYSFNNYNDHAIVMDLKEGQKIVNFCSPNYGLLKNQEVFPMVEKALSEIFSTYSKEYSVNHTDAVFTATYNAGVNPTLYKGIKKEQLIPQIIIGNSYNSSKLFNVSYGVYRQICSNGLWGVTTEKFSYSHTEGKLERMIEKLKEVTRLS